ncbi:class I lanthipeptide [Bacteroides heparinolyticus]|uniref:class I lanthipeptide n=1 Tax=Prevotella heparinolytica TaxID=28113 RepID=UPI0035A06063
MKKVKLSLNKTMIARLNSDEQGRIQGGEQPTTTGMGCIQNTDYPICAWSGCWGGRPSCPSMYDEESGCKTQMTENVNCGEW